MIMHVSCSAVKSGLLSGRVLQLDEWYAVGVMVMHVSCQAEYYS